MVGLKEGMGTCSICRKISATDSDHLHCREKRRIDLEKDTNNMGKEIKALLGHMNREREKSE